MTPDPQTRLDEAPRWLLGAYVAIFLVAFAVFVAAGLLLAVTVPYHQWDAFAFSELSRAIEAGRYELRDFSAAVVHRPLFYVLQGWLWSALGFSFASGRLLGLAFFVVLVAGVWRLSRDGAARFGGLSGALGGLLVLCVPAASAQAIAGLSDVPAAAMVAATAAVALTTETGRVRWGALAALAALTMLTKPSVLAPLGGLAIAVLLAEDGVDGIRVRDGGRARARATLAPLAVGIGIGLFAHLLAARRLGVGLYEYLTAGSGGYWADRAAQERWDAALRLDVLGSTLRLPLAFILVYALLRLVGRAHRSSAIVALGLAATWMVVGGVVAGEGEIPLWSPEAVFAWIGFLALLVGFVAVPSELAPTRARVVQLALVGVPPLLVWWYATPYADRLAATSWPGLCALVAVTLAVPIAALARTAGIAALAPALVLLVAVWVSLSSLDGFGADQWREYRSLGRGGIRDENRTLNIVLPAVQAANELIRPAMGSGGRLSTSDPRFSYWFPGRVSVGYITQCTQLAGFSAFILLTSDESRAQLEAEGGSGEPGWWADCEQPRLRQVSDGENGFAVFLIED